LTVSEDYKSIVRNRLDLEILSDPRSRRIAQALLQIRTSAEAIDFRTQIADLTDDEQTLLSGIALDQSPEPTEKDVDQLLKRLEIDDLKAKASALQRQIKSAQDEGKDTTELMRTTDTYQKRIASLKRKG
jgi:FtsZ-binding cell division protein ZapB